MFNPGKRGAERMNEPSQNKAQPGRKTKPFIYLVDDESLLLDLAEATLDQEGYPLKKFQDPEAALKSFLKEKSKPALLVTDYAMGKMNGLELIAKCKQAHPDLKSLLISGTAGAEIILNAPVKVDRFLGKPYQPATLVEMVRQILGG